MSPAGRAALRRAADQPGMDPDRFHDTLIRYAWAVHREDACLQEWLRQGQPITLVQTNGVEGDHPLLRQMAIAQRDAAKLISALRMDPANALKNATGRPPGAASAPDRTASPPKLRMVGK